MAGILSNLRNAVIAGLVLAALMLVLYLTLWGGALDGVFWRFLFRWLHVLAGVMWIGLLWYFNFVQIPTMASIPDEQKPAIGKHIAPAALWWFRWGATATIATGLILAVLNGYFMSVMTLGVTTGFAVPGHTALGIGIPAKSAQYCEPVSRSGCCGQSRGRAYGDVVLAHQHGALLPDAVCDGFGPGAVSAFIARRA